MTVDDDNTARRAFLKGVGTAGALGATGIAGCLGDQGGDGVDEITFGQLALLSGEFSSVQPPVSQATDVAIQEINDAGGPLGATVSVNRRDTAFNPQQAREVSLQFKNNEDATVLIGGVSDSVVALMDFFTEEQIPVITPWAGTTTLLDRGGDNGTPEDLSDDEWVWRTLMGDTLPTAGASLKTHEEFDRIATMNQNSEGARSWMDSYTDIYTDLGGEVVESLEFERGKTSYQSELSRLFEADFGAWALAPGNPDDAITILREWSDAEYGKKVFLENNMNIPRIVEEVGDVAEGAWVAGALTEGPNYDRFLDMYNDAGDATLNKWAAPAYDATILAALAIQRAGEASRTGVERNLGPVARPDGETASSYADAKEILEAGDEVDFQGAATPCDFDDKGGVLGNVGVYELHPDGWEQVDTIEQSELRELL